MESYQKTGCTLAGIMAGVIIVHPYVMLVNRLTGPGPFTKQSQNFDVSGFLRIIDPDMLPMTIAFAFFGGVCGLLLALLIERNRHILHYRYQVKMHGNLTTALHQLLGVISHYILNSSLIICAHARQLEKKTTKKNQLHVTAIISQAQKNESVLKLIQETEFLQNIDPSNDTYQKLIELNQKIEKHLKQGNGEV